ncbi:MAG: 16S rRNA (cytosine(967)-C(5))-methyltransferase RsmB [Geobacter sp.]|nr:MAG: 16S rRNA (cytosine(967)-C(5))-methyltransferase RsmB [Geobacter sp.]
MTTTSRSAAFEILLRIEKERSYADILLDHELTHGTLQGPDRGLLTELVYGVLRRQGTLDHVIDQFASQKTGRLERSVHILLRLGIYQLLYLDRVPTAAAVHATVELAKTLAPRASGFINAVLRQTDRERQNIRFPDPVNKPAAYLAAAWSEPAWLTARWLEQLGMEEAESLARTMVEPAPLTIRVNTLRATRDELQARLADEGADTTPCRYSPDGLRIVSPVAIGRLAGFREGLFTVQDESSQLAAIFLSPAPGERILDLCAAPGGKTTYLAQLMGNSGTVLASDIGARKLRLVEETARRLGINTITTSSIDATKPPTPLAGERFDRILVDAPCSGLGVIRRNPEGKWWKSPADITALARTQRTILRNAARILPAGGTILYGVCTTDREENEAVIEDFLSEQSGFVLEDLRELFPDHRELFTEEGYFRSWPHRHGMDGFFAARLRKI